MILFFIVGGINSVVVVVVGEVIWWLGDMIIITVRIIVMKRSICLFVWGSVGVEFFSMEIVLSFLLGCVIVWSADFTRLNVGRK